MARSESLAEKYERSKRQNRGASESFSTKYSFKPYDNNENDLLDYTSKPRDYASKLKADYRDKYLTRRSNSPVDIPIPRFTAPKEVVNERPLNITSRSNIPYLSDIQANYSIHGSPIKRIRFTPTKIRPAQIYKVLNHEASGFNTKTKSILSTKNKQRYNPKSSRSSISELKPQKKGLFTRLRNFLTNLTVNGSNSDFDLLSNSARELLDITVTSPIPAKKVNFNEKIEISPEKPRIASPLMKSTPLKTPLRFQKRELERDYAGDNDLIDETLRLNSDLQKRKDIQQRVNVLLDKIEEEKLHSRTLTANYHNEITNLKAEYEFKLDTLKSRIIQLEKDADARKKHIEESKILELRADILKEHENFLIRQRRNEEELKNRQNLLELKQKKLDSEYQRLEQEKSEQEILRDEVDRKNHLLITSIKQRRSELKNELFSKLESNKQKFEFELLQLQQQKLSIESNIGSHEADFVEFNERVQKMSEEILDKKSNYSLQEMTFLKGLEHLLDTLAKVDEKNRLRANNNRYHRQYILIDAKLGDYSIFFLNFQSVFNSNSTEYLEVYNQENLRGIEVSFDKLSLNLKKKFLKKNNRLKQLDSDISRFQFKIKKGDILSEGDGDQGGFGFKNVINSFQTRFEILEEMRTINHLLIHLNSLEKELNSISIVIQNSLAKDSHDYNDFGD